jgi:hypothetical protein
VTLVDDRTHLGDEPAAADDRSLWLARKGLETAVLRCAAALQWGGAAGGYLAVIAASEAAMWACALDRRGESAVSYASRRDADRDGRVMRGLRWSYDTGALYAAAAPSTADIRAGEPSTMRFIWPASVVVVAAAEPRTGNLLARGAYDRHLAGGPVIDTLRAAERWLNTSLRAAGQAGGRVPGE